jgi:uncharacterized membrane protein (DUF485 family)
VAMISSFTRAPETDQYLGTPAGRGDSLTDAEGNPDFAAIRRSPEFRRYRRRLLMFTMPAAALFLCWYMTYVLLAAYAHDFMSRKVFGSVNVAVLLGLSQFVTTVVIMLLYVRFAKRHVDPVVADLRERAGVSGS